MAYGPTKCVTCEELGCPTEGMTKMCSKCGGIYCFGHFGRHREEAHHLCYLCEEKLPCSKHFGRKIGHMNAERIISELSQKYPGKKIIKLPEDNPTEIICETDPASNHPENSTAVAVIDKSEPHYHEEATETYRVKKGHLIVIVENQPYKLREGDSLGIRPGNVHYAIGEETWAEVRSEPGWTPEDHILVE